MFLEACKVRTYKSGRTAVPGRKVRQKAIGEVWADMDPAAMRLRLLSVLADASEADETEGAGWYLSGRSVAADLATEFGYSVAQSVGVIAALSPQNGWGNNVVQAGEALGAGSADEVGHYDDATGKASAILSGDLPEDVLGGRKVRSFYRNLLDPLRPGHVTVDRHMVDLLTGERFADSKVLERVGAYHMFAAVIRGVARELGLLPQVVQAVAWVSWRRAHDVAYRFDGAEF
jgi:hypothetical protein